MCKESDTDSVNQVSFVPRNQISLVAIYLDWICVWTPEDFTTDA